MKQIVGIIIGMVLLIIGEVFTFSIGTAFGDGKSWQIDDAKITLLQNGSINCYIATAPQATTSVVFTGTNVSISCLKVK